MEKNPLEILSSKGANKTYLFKRFTYKDFFYSGKRYNYIPCGQLARRLKVPMKELKRLALKGRIPGVAIVKTRVYFDPDKINKLIPFM